MPSPSPLAAIAQTGFANGASYDRYRPSYSPEAVETLLRSMNVLDLPGARIVDLAAGTGKFTELLAAREENYEIIAVEPHEGMRQELERKKLRNVTVLGDDAAHMKGLEDQSADAVVAAQVDLSFECNRFRRTDMRLRRLFIGDLR